MLSDSENENGASRPATPVEEDCCHNACDPCIFDVHRKLLDDYERRKRQNIKETKRKNVLSPTAYRNFNVIAITETVENYILFSLREEENEQEDDVATNTVVLEPGQYVMLNAWGLSRPFTPIAWSKKSVVFLAKLYPNGKFTSQLRNTNIGEKIRMRGPYGDFSYTRNSFSFENVVMFSMGSGIAAHFPLAKEITADDLEETRVHMVGAFREIEQLPLRKEVQSLCDYWNFKCTMHISQPSDNGTNCHGINIKYGRINEESVSAIIETSSADTTLILICGTEEFNRSVKKWTEQRGYKNIYIFR